jgi:phosphatidate cytidylyltransferase
MIGGYLLSIISITIFANDMLEKGSLPFNWLIFVLLVSSISQLGDIFISYFKRLSKIKDTGKIIPGHGGLLDRIDGMIFAFPFSYIILMTNFL